MKNIKKFLFTIAFFSVLITPSFTSAVTVDELQAQINALMAQINALKTQLAQLQSQPGEWCHNFNVNLKFGDQGNEVEALHTALEKEGFNVFASGPEVSVSEVRYFSEKTASAVTGFQQKYTSEILTPVGLKYGTGFVGPSTRAKLNKLYACAVAPTPTTPSITVLSPNGGETLQEGSEYKIRWNASNLPADAKIHITLSRSTGENKSIVGNLPATQQEYVWKVDTAGGWATGYEYKPPLFAKILAKIFGVNEVKAAGPVSYQIMVSASWGTYGTAYYGNVYDTSDGWFYINPPTQPSITVLSPNGGEVWKIGKNYEVRWTSNKLPAEAQNRISISIYPKDCPTTGKCGITLLGSTANDGSEIIYVYPSIPHGEYKVNVGYFPADAVSAAEFIQDFSDNYLSLVSTGLALWDWNYCSADRSCLAGQGDCDKDTDCATGYCAIDVGNKYGQVSSMDVCEVKGEVSPSITVLSPNGGEVWEKGKTYEILWKSTGVSTSATIVGINLVEYDPITGLSRPWVLLRVSALLGKYSWTIPLSIKEGSIYKISIGGSGLMDDDSDALFSIVAPGTPFITVASPNGGEQWAVGSTQTISWSSSNVSRVSLDLVNSYGGLVVKNLVNMTGNPGSASWTIPTYIQTGQYWMRVGTCPDSVSSCVTTGSVDPVTIYDTSDASFSIVAAGTPSITVLSPNGGETWTTGNAYTVTWKSSGVSNINLSLAPETTSGGITECVQGQTTSYLSASSGNYSMRIPSDICAGKYKIRIIDYGNSAVQDTSDAPFSIVAAGGISYPGFYMKTDKQSYALNDTVILTLSRADGRPETYSVDLYALKSGQEAKTLIQSNLSVGQNTNKSIILNSWSLFEQGGAGNYLLSVCGAGQTCIGGVNTNSIFFTLVSSSITVISPNGGEKWERGKEYLIKWQYTGLKADESILIELFSPDTGKRSITRVGAGSPSYPWQVPSDITPNDKYKIRMIDGTYPDTISDTSDNYFSMSLSLGDVDGNGRIDVGDSLFITQYVQGSRTLTQAQLTAADVNKDGKVSTNDAKIISQYDVRLYTSLPVNVKVGDIDKSGMITSGDALLVLQYLAGQKTFDAIQEAAADVNNDSQITQADADAISSYSVGNIKELPIPYVSPTGAGLKGVENQLASVANAISQLIEGIKELMGR